MEPHPYLFTMTGRCGACGQPETEHPVLLQRRDPDTDCIVDHASVSTAFVVGEHGGEWRRCPDCRVQIEGALAKGSPVGPVGGIGRGPATERMKRRWLFVAHMNSGKH